MGVTLSTISGHKAKQMNMPLFPANVIHLTQPLDVAIFEPMKKKWKGFMTCSVKTATIQVASRNNGILTYIPLNPDEVLKRMMDNGTSCECQFSANIPTTSKNVKKEKENRNIIEAKD